MATPPTSVLVIVLSGERMKDINNLQALKPSRRPFSFVAVSSHLFAPRGFVPGGVEVGCGQERGGIT
jgi:hypothetical protein